MRPDEPPPGVPEAFYLPAGDGRYEPTAATMSPWDFAFQHGGPPLALLAAAVDTAAGEPGLRLARITAEFLRPIPRRTLSVSAQVVRPGRRTRMTDAALVVDGDPVVLARAWHVEAAARPPARGAAPPTPAPMPPVASSPTFPGLAGWGYGPATEWRFAGHGFGALGPAQVWTRVRLPLVAGRPITGLERLLVVADSANGISAELPLESWLSIPTSITVTLARHPAGEWVYLDARTQLAPDGIGLTTAELADTAGPLGVVAQPLLVAPRFPA